MFRYAPDSDAKSEHRVASALGNEATWTWTLDA
jgi:hypothetical protein